MALERKLRSTATNGAKYLEVEEQVEKRSIAYKDPGCPSVICGGDPAVL